MGSWNRSGLTGLVAVSSESSWSKMVTTVELDSRIFVSVDEEEDRRNWSAELRGSMRLVAPPSEPEEGESRLLPLISEISCGLHVGELEKNSTNPGRLNCALSLRIQHKISAWASFLIRFSHANAAISSSLP